MFLFQLQLFTFVLLFVQFLLPSLALAFAAATVSSVACGSQQILRSQQNGDNAIIVFFIISSFTLSVMSVIQHVTDKGSGFRKNCKRVEAYDGAGFMRKANRT